MHPIKALGAIAAAIATTWTAADALRFAPTEGTTVQKSFETETDFELDELSLIVDGQDLGSAFSPRMSLSGAAEIVLTDVYDGVGEGRATKLTRTFDALVADMTFSVEMMGDSDEQGAETSSPLDGETVVFTWDDEEGEYRAEFAEGSGADEDLLEGLEAEVDMLAMLPSGEVEEGDSWTFDPKVLQTLLAPGGNLGWSSDEMSNEDLAEFEEVMGEFGERMLDSALELLEGEGTATYAGRRDDLGVITLEVEISSSADFASVLQDLIETAIEEAGDEVPPDVDVLVDAADVTLDVTGEGQLLWDLEAGIVSGLTMAADVEIAMDLIVGGSADGEEQEFEVSVMSSGVVSTEMTTSR